MAITRWKFTSENIGVPIPSLRPLGWRVQCVALYQVDLSAYDHLLGGIRTNRQSRRERTPRLGDRNLYGDCSQSRAHRYRFHRLLARGQLFFPVSQLLKALAWFLNS
jgi:hypothetical protein